MRVECPQCQNRFSAKTNARRIKCPECGFREVAPEDGGFASAFASGKRRTGGFSPVEPRTQPKGSGMTGAWVAGGLVVLVLAGALAWYFLQDDGSGGAAAQDRCGSLANATLPLSNPSNPAVLMSLEPDGCIAIELFMDKAPLTAGNFKSLVESGYYNNTGFHRVMRDFMMQGGDGASYGKGPAQNIPDEYHPDLKHDLAGRLSMANTGAPNSGNSQFFITFVPTPNLDAYDAQGNRKACGTRGVSCHAVFGQVVAGMDVVQKINVEAGNPSDGPPLRPINVTGARVKAATVPGTSTTTSAAPPLNACVSVPSEAIATQGGPAQIDLVTPGVWNVCAAEESMYIWIHNAGNTGLDYTWSITGPGGEPLPDGWSVTFEKPGGTLAANGTPGPGPSGNADWAATVAKLTVPADQASGEFPAELHAAGSTRAFTFHVHAPFTRVSHVGDALQTHYDLRYLDGTAYAQGPFCVVAARPGAVEGFAFGSLGVALGETVELIVPPPLHYGYGGRLGSQTMEWSTRVDSFETSCPM